MKNKVYIISILLILIIGLSGCGTTDTTTEEENIKTGLLEEGVLHVAMQAKYAPMEYVDDDGNLTGFDVEFAKKIADEMGLKLEIHDVAWDAIFKELESHKYDMIVSSCSFTKDRDEKYSLTKPYMENGLVLVTEKNSDIKSFEDIADKNIGVQLSTTADSKMLEYKEMHENMEVSRYEDVIHAYTALKNKEVDAVCSDQTVFQYCLGDKKDDYDVVWMDEQKEPYCIILSQENSQLRDNVEAIMKKIRQKGELKSLSEKYFEEDLTDSFLED